MSQTIRFALVLHNHQPVGNFDGVFEQAYQDSYRPFLDVFEGYSDLRLGLHTSGSLMEWLDRAHPEYIDRLAELVAAGRIEILGGPFYEPILTMIPSRDRVGQIRRYTQWLEARLGADIQGMWMPERVWEQSLTADLAEADMRYTMLDDFHFKNAGAAEDALHGYYVTEDQGRVLSVFPGSERLRYLIPFAAPEETINYLSVLSEKHPGSVVLFADDGEKFGTWPDTKQHVYDNGWLRQFFDLLAANQSWLSVTTPGEVLQNVPPLGKIYLPDASYREMTEWALPTSRLLDYEHLRHEMEHDPRWPRLLQFMRGGFWRNFKVKYPETNEMYARMLQVSNQVQAAQQAGVDDDVIDQARQDLYRGQCNCSYWHGAFGGTYLPHLRNAVFRHLIAAETTIETATKGSEPWVQAQVADWNLDARQEVKLSSDKLVALFAPAAGGVLYELDVRSICHNLLATLARRPEPYHEKVLQGGAHGNNGAASIHERIVFKQEGLDQRLGYDSYQRKSLVDHFYPLEASGQDVAAGRAEELGDFVEAVYEASLGKNPDRIQVKLSRSGLVGEAPVKITKGVTMSAGASVLQIAYLLENLPPGEPVHFAVELNFAGLPAGADDRFFYGAARQRLGQLGAGLDLSDATSVGLVDEWLGIDVHLSMSQVGGVWTYPIEAVSQSEGGFELVHQSVVVVPHWTVRADHRGVWSVAMELALDTSLAESREKVSETFSVPVAH